jgi:hypothetical protein
MRPGLVGQLAAIVAVVMAEPGHGEGQIILIAARGCQVEKVVGSHKNVDAAGKGRVGVEDFAALVLEKDAEPRAFQAGKFG